MAIGNAIQGFARGYGLGEQTKARKDEQAYREERDRVQDERYERKLGLAESEAERQAAIERRERLQTDLQNAVRGAHEYLRGRGIQSPDQMTDADRKRLSGILTPAFQGVQVDPEFMASDEGARATQIGDQVAESGDLSPLADPEARRLAGQAAFGGFVRQGEGQKSRSGKPRKRQRVVDVTPTEKPGQLAVMTRVTDVDGEENDAPVTQRRSADEDDPVRTVPMEQAMDRFLGYRALSHGLEDEGLMPFLRATYAQAGGDPSELRPETDYKTIKRGNQEVTYRTEDGRIVGEPIAEAGRWQPRQAPDAPADVREYEYARAQGFEGSFEDWKRQGDGGRPKGSMTNYQRTRLMRDEVMRRAAQREGVMLYKDESTGMLEFVPADDTKASQRAVQEAEADVQRSLKSALEQDRRGETVTGLADAPADQWNPQAELDRVNAGGLSDASGAQGGGRSSPYRGLWSGSEAP
ncbi:hypothetical protein [Algiphilus aromaticivorans]|uniref:hypothetical protein n=1 Tax=Algiphilus aromaticivorans TaxID=382454 RepID=UPI0005C24868|nr:hypothetical protein [Algiphilus aromaticivorans]